MSDSSDGWVGLVVVFGLIWYYTADRDKEVSVYQLNCDKPYVGSKCSGKQTALVKTTYKASFEGQTVVYWADNFTPSRFHYCSVRDSENWECNDGPEAVSKPIQGMVNGDLTESMSFAYFNPRQVSRWRWYYTKSREWLGV